jgi:hypothetical protein
MIALAGSESFFGFEHPIGGAVSIVGAFLLAVGWVGKKRLEGWDEDIADFLERLKMEGKRLLPLALSNEKRVIKSISTTIFAVPGCALMLLCLAAIISLVLTVVMSATADSSQLSIPDSWWNRVVMAAAIFVFMLFLICGVLILYILIPALFFNAVVALAFAARYAAPILLWALIRISLAPYSLTRWVEKEGALERTFLFIGTIMTAVGIAMCLWKGPVAEHQAPKEVGYLEQSASNSSFEIS